MKRILLTLLAVFLGAGSFASADEWLRDYTQALSQAKAQNKPVLMDFTGSDWCPPCMRLNTQVFGDPEFKAYAAQKLVLLKLDFPRRKSLPEAETAQNMKLADQYEVDRFPTVIVLKPDGTKAGEVNALMGGTRPFLAALDRLVMRK